MVLLLLVLFVPMQWGAPSGGLTMYQLVLQMTPNVAGTVVEVKAEINRPTKKGELLFRLDPAPYQYQVDLAEARLAEAEQAVPQLKAAWDAAAASTNKAEVDQELAQTEFDIATRTRSRDSGAVSHLRVEQQKQSLAAATAALELARANETAARLKYQSEIDGSNTTVAQRKAELASARYNLEQTSVVAPADGRPLALTLEAGQRVGVVRAGAPLAYVLDDEKQLAMWIPQTYARHIEPGQQAEVVLQLHPGKVFPATVTSVTWMNAAGQVAPSATLPSPPTGPTPPGQYAVLLELDPDALPERGIPGAAVGVGAVYTGSAQATQLIRRVMLRMQAWMYYITA